MYAMVIYCLDISVPVIKFSQYFSSSAQQHYDAVKEILFYLKSTSIDSIYFCRKESCNDLPASRTTHETETDQSDIQIQGYPHILKCTVDADWGRITTHRQSIT